MDIAPEKGEKQETAPPPSAADDTTASSAEQRKPDSTGESLLDVVEKAAAASTAAQESGKKFDPNLGSDQKPAAEAAPSAAKEEPGADGKTVLQKDKLDTDGKEIPPFNEHPRWKEVTTERNELRAKMEEYERDWKPLVTQQKGIVDYCTENGISPEQFQQTLEVMALMNTNPREALKRIQPVIDNLKQFDETALPPDLEKRVVEENLDIETAREIAALRAQAKGQEYNGNVLRQRGERAAHAQRMNALVGWEQSMMGKDPDFKPKAKETDPNGKYETVVNEFRGLVAQRPPRDGAELVAMLQYVYDSVNKMFTTRLSPRQPTGKMVTATGSSAAIQEKEPQSLEEVVFATAAKHGAPV
jgi:hypothetical protein